MNSIGHRLSYFVRARVFACSVIISCLFVYKKILFTLLGFSFPLGLSFPQVSDCHQKIVFSMSTSYFMLRFINKRQKTNYENKTEKLLRHAKPIVSCENENVIQCRICLKVGTISIYSSKLPFDVQDAIRTFGDIDLEEDDSYPKHLCETCHSLLIGAIAFRKSAKESDKILRHTRVEDAKAPPDVEDDISNNSAENTENSYICETCKLGFSALKDYSAHKSSKLHKNARIQCPICHRLFTPHLYKNHALWHQSASHIVCEVCGKLYRKDNLDRHLQLHSYTLPFQCQVCPYKGRVVESLRIHMRTHSGEKPFSCDKCEHQSITRSNLNRHLLTHRKEKPHKCIECSRAFYTKRELAVHFKEDHTGMKDFGCRICGNKYSNRKAQMRHELRVHKRDKMPPGRMPLYLQAEYRKNDDLIK